MPEQPTNENDRKRKIKDENPVDLDNMLNLVADAADYVHEVITSKEDSPKESAKDQSEKVDPSNPSDQPIPSI